MLNPSEMASDKLWIRHIVLQSGWYILSHDLHAIHFRHGVDTQISQDPGMAIDPFQIIKSA